jgi:hypothetical protein
MLKTKEETKQIVEELLKNYPLLNKYLKPQIEEIVDKGSLEKWILDEEDLKLAKKTVYGKEEFKLILESLKMLKNEICNRELLNDYENIKLLNNYEEAIDILKNFYNLKNLTPKDLLLKVAKDDIEDELKKYKQFIERILENEMGNLNKLDERFANLLTQYIKEKTREDWIKEIENEYGGKGYSIIKEVLGEEKFLNLVEKVIKDNIFYLTPKSLAEVITKILQKEILKEIENPEKVWEVIEAIINNSAIEPEIDIDSDEAIPLTDYLVMLAEDILEDILSKELEEFIVLAEKILEDILPKELEKFINKFEKEFIGS